MKQQGVSDLDIFLQKVLKTDDCWIWMGWKDKDGYGGLTINKKQWRAHRWIYQHINGPIKKGLFICHRCDNPSCVNPEHLFEASHTENMLDSIKKGRHSRQILAKTRTHCKHGHEAIPENLVKLTSGVKSCLLCHRKKSREWAQRKRAES